MILIMGKASFFVKSSSENEKKSPQMYLFCSTKMTDQVWKCENVQICLHRSFIQKQNKTNWFLQIKRQLNSGRQSRGPISPHAWATQSVYIHF